MQKNKEDHVVYKFEGSGANLITENVFGRLEDESETKMVKIDWQLFRIYWYWPAVRLLIGDSWRVAYRVIRLDLNNLKTRLTVARGVS